MTQRRYDNERILVISDDHAPFQHKDAINFLEALKSEVDPDRVVHLGDMLDSYCFSRYPKDPDAMGANQELAKARRYTRKLMELFPSMNICESNHDSRLWDRARAAGIPKGLIVPYLSLLGADNVDWKLKRDMTLTVNSTRDQIYFTHYRAADVLEVAKLVGTHAVQGHSHSKMGIAEIETPTKHLFGMQVPCLISDSKYAFAYNRMQMIRPILGAACIINGVPKTIRMQLKKSGRWDGRLRI